MAYHKRKAYRQRKRERISRALGNTWVAYFNRIRHNDTVEVRRIKHLIGELRGLLYRSQSHKRSPRYGSLLLCPYCGYQPWENDGDEYFDGSVFNVECNFCFREVSIFPSVVDGLRFFVEKPS